MIMIQSCQASSNFIVYSAQRNKCTRKKKFVFSVAKNNQNNCVIAVIAVAIGPAVYFYKNMKPFFKYTFPSLKIDPLEQEIWRKVGLCYSHLFHLHQIKCLKIRLLLCLSVWMQLPFEKSGRISELVKNLRSIRINELSLVSQKLLSLPEEEQQVI